MRDKVRAEYDNHVRSYLRRVEQMDRLGVFDSPKFRGVDTITLRRDFLEDLVDDLMSGTVTTDNVRRLIYAKRGRGITAFESIRDAIHHMRQDLLRVYNIKYYS